MTDNCFCDETFDLFCYPRTNYKLLKKDPIHKKKYDFRKCNMRTINAMEFIENDYDKYKLIENGKTEKKRIIILKNIIIKDYKLTKEDFKIILEKYLVTEGNLINNYQEPIEIDEPIEIYMPDEIWKHIKEFMIDYKFKEKLPSYKKIYPIFESYYEWNNNVWWNGASVPNNTLLLHFTKVFEDKTLRKIALGLLKINIEILEKIYYKEVSYLRTNYRNFYGICIEQDLSQNSTTKNIFYIRWILIVLIYHLDPYKNSILADRLLTWYIL